MKQQWLKFQYLLFLGFNRLIQRVQWFYLKVIGYRSEIPNINASFNETDDLSFAGMLTRYFINRLAYNDSNPDYIKVPDYTIKCKEYNCNDISQLICHILHTYRVWLNPRLMIVYAPNERGHCVCIFYTKDGYLHASNYGVFGYYSTFDEIAKSIYPNWNYYIVADNNLKLLDAKLQSCSNLDECDIM